MPRVIIRIERSTSILFTRSCCAALSVRCTALSVHCCVRPVQLKAMFDTMLKLHDRGVLSAGHDVSDGGVVTTLLEMAFAGNCGIEVDLAAAKGVTSLDALFAEEAGLVRSGRAALSVHVHHTALSVHCTARSVQCTSRSVHWTTRSIHWTALSVHCTALRCWSRS
eukprot:6106480-Pyramimonas_sp.AAC.1